MKLTSPFTLSITIATTIVVMACSSTKNKVGNTSSESPTRDYTSHVLRITEEVDTFFDVDATYEILSEDLKYADGPLWHPQLQGLLFSEVEKNAVLLWKSDTLMQEYLMPSGYTGNDRRSMKKGSRGLGMDNEGNILLCQEGDGTVSIMAAQLTNPKPTYLPLFSNFIKKDMYGPTDLDIDKNGNVYFTDPAPIGFDFKQKEKWQLPFSGVYVTSKSGKVAILNDELTVPNGIALSNDQSFIIVANGDPANPYWQRTNIKSNLAAGKTGRIYKIDAEANDGAGVPNGLEFHKSSYLFATGPGGVWIFNPEFKLIGKILTASIATDCTFDIDYTYLYITTEDQLLRIAMK